MEYKKGDKLENEIGSIITIQGAIGEVYIVLYNNGDSSTMSHSELEDCDYTLITPEIPKDQTEVMVWGEDGERYIYVSKGTLDQYGNLECYPGSKYRGSPCVSWPNWKVIKCK